MQIDYTATSILPAHITICLTEASYRVTKRNPLIKKGIKKLDIGFKYEYTTGKFTRLMIFFSKVIFCTLETDSIATVSSSLLSDNVAPKLLAGNRKEVFP